MDKSHSVDRRTFLAVASGVLTYCAAGGGLDADSTPKTTLSLEDMMKLGAHHLERLVDDKGRTYFDVFRTQPPEAVTDWPDFVDLPSRYWEAGVLIESVLSSPVSGRERVANWLFSHLEADGLAYRPDGPISNHTAELFDQSRLLYALNSRVMSNPGDETARNRLAKLADGLKRLSTRQSDYAYIDKIGLYYGGTLIRPMLQAGIVLDRPNLVDFAAALARGVVDHSDLIGPDGGFSGHVHGALSCIAGIAALGIKTGDQHLLERGRTAFQFARGFSTDFGWVPESARHMDDVIACETCSIMDYLDNALLLARHVDASYFDVVEKAARNHLWESQIRDASWLGPEDGQDEDGVFRTALHDRVVGSFTGWSAPHCSLADEECFWDSWVKTPALRPRYTGKVRALQNCCAGAGIRAVHQVWSSIVTRDGDLVSVNLSLDRATPEVQVTSFVPFEGRVRIAIKRDVTLRWRPPSGCAPGSVRIKSSGPPPSPRANGTYLEFGKQRSGTILELTFPLPEHRQVLTMGNAGHQQYRFEVEWRGDTVLAIRPDPENANDVWVQHAGQRRPSYYHTQGPGPLYQRRTWSSGLAVTPASTVGKSAVVDWYAL
jgi:hypothetical protein